MYIYIYIERERDQGKTLVKSFMIAWIPKACVILYISYIDLLLYTNNMSR